MNVSALCRKAAAEGSVLLKNENNLLPLNKGTKVAVFGRAQTFYYKSGTGSGGLVHIDKEPCVIESLLGNTDLLWDETLINIYNEWIKENPFDNGGGGWASEPWYQKEMPIDAKTVKAAADRNDVAVVVFARTAGEDHDNAAEEGSYLLTRTEEQLLEQVSTHFEKVVVALNVGNIIDTSFLNKYKISSLLYIWQGGMEGANAFADLLSGKSAPSGKLTDTIALKISDYPSNDNFGDRDKNIYKEDVYVGYRYFESFAKEKVQFPFGFGLTYTDFEIVSSAFEENGIITVCANVKNIGNNCGRQVVQVYFDAPCGNLGTPARQLIAFAKTKELKPGESETVKIEFAVCDMASYDDSGVTENKSCYVLQAGDYTVYVGTDVRSAKPTLVYSVNDTVVTKRLEEIMPLTESFERLKAIEEDGNRVIGKQTVLKGTTDLNKRIVDRRPAEIPYTGDKGIKLNDVYNGKNTLEEFIAQLNDNDLAALSCGEGMSSPKATPGTGGALGGQTKNLSSYGIPVCCFTDGPSGVRLDTGAKASSIPNGTLLASTWDTELIADVYECVGAELKKYGVDALLGPGINIHRHPLCGRNFEYFSEDPYLAGKIAAAVTVGISRCGTYSTIKHFCANNQETNRFNCVSIVSERALREIYLKPFEIAVKQGENVLVMTAYNPVNGYWTASNYDLTKTVLRKEWGFNNFVMTDWWAKCNIECGSDGDGEYLQAMIRAENDVYMVCVDAIGKSKSILDGLKSGYIVRSELQLCAKNLCNWILRSNTFKEYLENGCIPKYPITTNDVDLSETAKIENPLKNTEYALKLNGGNTELIFSVLCNTDVLAQNIISVTVGEEKFTFTVSGTQGEYTQIKHYISIPEDGKYKLIVSHIDDIIIGSITVSQ